LLDIFWTLASYRVLDSLRDLLKRRLQYHQVSQLQAAEALSGEVLCRQPDQSDAPNLLGVMANQADQPEVAMALIEQAVGRLPLEPHFHGDLAAAYQAAGRVADAVRHYSEVIRLNSLAVNQYFFLSDVLLHLDQPDEALTLSLQARRLQVGRWKDFAVHLEPRLALATRKHTAHSPEPNAIRLEKSHAG
jgi:tetratricopeptide (TPR) repeat protein